MNIQDKAVLVDLKISVWNAQVTDHKISEEINITRQVLLIQVNILRNYFLLMISLNDCTM